MAIFKIVFAGPVGAGKSTAIKTLSDFDPVESEELASDDVKNMKSHTTVAMDYGAIELDDGTQIHLYGTPGQTRFSFIWSIVKENSGTILLIDHTYRMDAEEIMEYLLTFDDGVTPLIVGLSKSSNRINDNEQFIKDQFKSLGKYYPTISIDPRSKNDLQKAVLLLTSIHLASVN
jgi:uncharacterized protein